VGQFSGSGTNYVEWDNLLGVGQFIWDRDNLVGEGLIFERGTIYWEWDYLFEEGLFIWRGTIYLGPGQFSGRGTDF
jgi:hypothetical protein